MSDKLFPLTSKSTLPPAIKAWELYMRDQGRPINTIKAFTSDMKILLEYFPPETRLEEFTLTKLNNYLEWMKNERPRPCSPKTLTRRITSLKAFFAWLHRYGVIPNNPAEKVVQISSRSPLPVVLTTEEVVRVLETANQHRFADKPDARYYALIALLLHTGIKKRECVNLHLNHIDLDGPEGPSLFVHYANPQYRYKERKIPLPPEWVPAFQEYLEQYRPIDQVFPWSPRRLEYLLEDISNEAGLEKHLSFDMCRWTSVLMDYRAGMEPERIRQKMGISKIQWREVSSKLAQLDKKYS